MNRKIFTIGYTGFDLDDFVARLQKLRIECLIDVREIPRSRKRGFSKSSLTARLSENNIGYKHFRWLGSPRLLRHEVRQTGDYEAFFSGVECHLQSMSAIDQLEETVKLGRELRCCLMCCCEDWYYCHRRCVIDAVLQKSHFSVEHLSRGHEPKSTRKAA